MREQARSFAVTRSDDEYSVALLAFYEAIEGYDPESGPFGAYASLVIGRRFADHYRSQHRFDAEMPLVRRRSTARWTARVRTPPCSRRSRSR